MYSIEINNAVCYDDTQIDDVSYRLIDYKLVMEDSKAGSLTMVVPPTNRAYSQCSPNMIRRRPLVYFFENEQMLWVGRAVSVKYDFWNRATVVCEGALAWLADALYEGLGRQAVQTDTDVARTKIQGALSGYTRHMSTSAYRIDQGMVTMQIEGEAEWTGIQQGYAPAQSPDTTKTCLQRITDLVSRYGGHVQVLNPNGSYLPRLVWYADIYGTAQSGSYVQTANFGENLMDYVRSFSTDGLVTVLRPYGDIKDNAPKVEQEKTALITSDMLTNYKRINTSGSVENSPSSLQNVSDPLTIVRGRKYYYSGHMRSNFCLFVITDTDGNVYNLKTNHGGEPTGSTVIKEYNNVEIPIPEFAQNGNYKIQCGFWQDTAYETEKSVSLLDYSNLYYVDEDQSEDDDKYRVSLADLSLDQTYEISDLVQEYGWIEERVTFKNINSATGLLAATQTLAEEISSKGFNFESLSVGFLDMAYFIQSDAPKVGTAVVGSAVLSDGSTRVPPLKLYDGVRVVSDPHHVDTVMYVTKIELSINPANSKITLGVSKEKGISALVGG